MAGRKVHYAWVILVACIAFYAVPVGVIGNCQGVYVQPIMDEFGWSRTQTTLYLIVQQLVAAATAPFAGKVLARFNPRWVLTATSVVFGANAMACALYTQPWQWVVYGAVYGVCAGFILFLALPTIVNIWFRKRNGLAIGVASAFIGVFAAVCSPITQVIIDASSWQTARVVMSVACMLLSALPTALLLRRSPESMGVLPYGANPERAERAKEGSQGAKASVTLVEQGATASQARRSPALYLLILVAGGFGFCATLVQHLSAYCSTGELGAMVGAYAVSIAMVGSIVGKPGFGWLADKVGAVRAGITSSVFGAAGVAIILVSGANAALFFLGTALFGLGYSALSIVSPLLGSQGFGSAHFSEIYSWVSSGISLLSALAGFALSFLYDVTGSFTADFVLVIAIYVLCAILCPVVVRSARRLWV
ncbi:MFS transporter [Adlercreutzia aquisgranensis]|uniref:MFS transporter n=1 Tax=Adlercreutzia aquisgranensis TaxID=2941323 RepID=UPI00203FE14A|nr:MFS transporter [Adlercreutzia aquisgranensis]